MNIDYKEVEFTLHEILVQIEDAYKLLEFDKVLLDQIGACKELVKTKHYSVAVMGEFKRGKSSLINALLGSKILPADATPTTATINRITYAPDPKTVITYKDGGEEEICIDTLCDYVTKLTADGEHRASKIREATVYYPTVICQNHVDIIDTPGLNDEEHMTKITIDMLPYVDAVIVPIHARAPFSATEKNFVCQLLENENINNIIFVITYIDQLDEDEYNYDDFINYIKNRICTEVIAELDKREAGDVVINKAHKILDNISLSGISSSLALKSFVTNNRADLKKSGFEEFRQELLNIVTAKQIENTVRKSIDEVNFLLAQKESQNQTLLNHTQKEMADLKAAFESVKAYCHNGQKYLDSLFAANYDKLNQIASHMNISKNAAMSLFIRELSGIRQNTHAVIKDTLESTAKHCEVYFKDELLSAVVNDIYTCLSADLQPLKAYRETALILYLDYFEFSKTDNVKTLTDAMLYFAKNELNKLMFYWTRPPVPDVRDLSNYNVIETIIEAIDESVTACVRRTNECLVKIRKNWLNRITSEAKSINGVLPGIYQDKYEVLDRKLKARINNYSILEKDVAAISNRCCRLKKEILI